MQIQRIGQDLVIVLSAEAVQQQGFQEGDKVVVIKHADRTTFEQAFAQVLQDHAGTFAYLSDK